MERTHASIKAPAQCSEREIADFARLVLAGGEVAPVGLERRARKARLLSFLRSGDKLIAVAGLKIPSAHHRAEVEMGARVKLPVSAFPLELGWVYVMPSARGGKSFGLCSPLVGAASQQGIFATSRANNPAMHHTLMKLGFARAGGEWPSGQNPAQLWLFTKPQDVLGARAVL
jgi:hypothetical protein